MAERVEDTVKDLAARHFKLPRGTVDLDMPLADAPDSLKLSELVIALEQHFDIALEDSAIAQARLLRDVVTLVETRVAAAARA